MKEATRRLAEKTLWQLFRSARSPATPSRRCPLFAKTIVPIGPRPYTRPAVMQGARKRTAGDVPMLFSLYASSGAAEKLRVGTAVH
jgi:hypothetical protein